MTELWTTLLPVALVTAVMPGQVVMTILMLRAPGGVARAGAWVGGMTIVRLAQFALLFLVIEPATDDGTDGTSLVEGALLLVVAMLLLVAAGRKLADQPDEDAPPPRWMTMVTTWTPQRAFLAGAGLVALSPKLWAFTLAGIGAIADAELSLAGGWLVFIVFVVLSQAGHLAALTLAAVAPRRADTVLGTIAGALERHSRSLMIVLSAAFGIWFVVKALAAFGIP